MSLNEYTDKRGWRYVAEDATWECDGCAHDGGGEERDAGCLAAPACGYLRGDGRNVVWVLAESGRPT